MKYDYKGASYIKCAMNEIDEAFENIEIDDAFYYEFYKLKRKRKLHDIIFNSVLIGILTAVVVSLAFEAKKVLGTIGFSIFIILGSEFCIYVVKQNYPTKQYTVLNHMF